MSADTGNLVPPDTHRAVGHSHYVQIVNARYLVYSRAGTLLSSRTLMSLFNTTTEGMIFDPRVIYDPVWRRWIAIATRRASSSTDSIRRLYIAVSTSSSPTGSYHVYNKLSLPIVAGEWCDYPQLGMDYDSILFTGNVFTYGGALRTTFAFSLPKGILYNGSSISGYSYSGLAGTLAPPIVRDRNVGTFFVAAPTSGTVLKLYTMTNSSRIPPTFSGQVNVAVPAYTFPRDAKQPGTTRLLDTLDSRFVNASAQVGGYLYNVHSVNFVGFPGNRFYRINTSTKTLHQWGWFYEFGDSDDWNASIATNDAGDVFVTWSATRPSKQAHIRASGKRFADAAIPAGFDLPGGTSTTFYTYDPSIVTRRWGDYSPVTTDPLNGNNAWVTNQRNYSTTVWGSRIGMIGF